ncbi:hypothetical protein BBD42_07310 [Paenibacillus sp. BIHB 4019]|uniref:Oxidoreductase n=1 Tax=Paenibacillus sp. BIHB 4019 TaxID=1870819 RepID=A0A1B2DF24_9BACL|nr:Gfo/Idh/MocA family oxidoreductase [Paenibacillus sp. BIHB 4019]ANY66296.1 hypothetical protein BBD42_07310 [Paenibacillus sp. BIHB 4019]
MMGRKVKYKGVIIGAGHFSDVQLEAWQSVSDAEMVAIYDIDAAKADQLASKYEMLSFHDFDQMIREVNPDFIDICTPPASHFEYVRFAVDLGLPVLCQKPLAPTLSESEELVRYAAERNVPLMVNENWRWQPWYRHIKRVLEEGQLGEIFYANFAMRPGDGWGESPYPVQPYFREMERFLMFETGIHFIDTFRFLFGEISSVYCQSRRINPVIRGEDLSIMFANFSSGMVAVYDANRVAYTPINRSPTYGNMVIEGTEGKLRLDEEGRIFLINRGGTETEFVYEIPSGYKGGSAIATQRHFVDCLAEGRGFETSGSDYLTNMRILFSCYDSMQHKGNVAL